jgi:integrase
MGLTKRKDSYYVEFAVLDDGTVLSLASPGTGKLKRWKVGSRNRRVAQDREALIKTRLMTGREASPCVARSKAMTFRAWAQQYLNLEQVTKLRGYAIRRLYVDNLTRFFGEMPLAAITPQHVRQYREQRLSYRGKPVSIQTINHDHMTLTHMLNVACSPEFGLLTVNAAAHVPKPNPHNERDRIATPEEWLKLKDAAAPHLRHFLTVLYALGPRRGELLRLEWSDVDMRRKEFTLRQTKNGENRTVPMTPEVYATFTALWQERRLDTPRVFLYNGKPVTKLATAFRAACRRAGITNLRLHDFRHTASTNLRRAGVDTATAMKIVVHKSERMHRRYNTIEPEDLHRAATKLAAYQANTLITPVALAVGGESVTPQKTSESGRSSVVES